MIQIMTNTNQVIDIYAAEIKLCSSSLLLVGAPDLPTAQQKAWEWCNKHGWYAAEIAKVRIATQSDKEQAEYIEEGLVVNTFADKRMWKVTAELHVLAESADQAEEFAQQSIVITSVEHAEITEVAELDE
jgi:hypothetical protein